MPLTQEQIQLAKDVWCLDKMSLSSVNLEKALLWFGKRVEKVMLGPQNFVPGVQDIRLSERIEKAK